MVGRAEPAMWLLGRVKAGGAGASGRSDGGRRHRRVDKVSAPNMVRRRQGRGRDLKARKRPRRRVRSAKNLDGAGQETGRQRLQVTAVTWSREAGLGGRFILSRRGWRSEPFAHAHVWMLASPLRMHKRTFVPIGRRSCMHVHISMVTGLFKG
eukprot:281817-Chlamydomonas_euryale.AAC.8